MQPTSQQTAATTTFRFVHPLARFVVGLCAAASVAASGWHIFGPLADQRTLQLAGNLGATPKGAPSRDTTLGNRRESSIDGIGVARARSETPPAR